MPAAATPWPSTPAGPVLVGQQHGQVLMHFDRPVTWASVTPAQALAFAYQLVAAARAAGLVQPQQRALFAPWAAPSTTSIPPMPHVLTPHAARPIPSAHQS